MPSSEHHDCGGVRLHVRRWACPSPSAPTVVLLPGTGHTAAHWDGVAAPLSRDRTVCAVDLRGHGDSDWPGTYSIELMARDVTNLLPLLGDESVDLVGHSLGGLVACAVASCFPGIRRLVLEDVGLLRARTPVPVQRPPGDLDLDWAVVEQVRPEIDTPSPSWLDVLCTLPVPVLAVGGGPTSFVPQQWVEDLALVVPDATMTTIDAGHEVHETRPAEFLDVLRRFLDAST